MISSWTDQHAALDKLASRGLRYNQFHTTALCSPTRTTLLTGRNHHMNNMGGITEVATAFPGNTGVRPNAIAPLAEILPDEARADFAAISDDLDFIKSQLSRQPDRAWLSRMGLIGFGSVWALLAAVVLLLAR